LNKIPRVRNKLLILGICPTLDLSANLWKDRRSEESQNAKKHTQEAHKQLTEKKYHLTKGTIKECRCADGQ